VRLIVEPPAQADIDDAAIWYDSQDFGLGSAFIASLKSLLNRIAEKPERYPFHQSGLRRASMRRFPYAVFYTPPDDSIYIHAVIPNLNSKTRF
jgi:plasmid stabilization system protein ParE